MTNEEKRKAHEMYLAGESTESIAKQLQYCRSTIYNNLPKGVVRHKSKAKNIIYPGLAKWLVENKTTIKNLSLQALGKDLPHISLILRGKIEPRKTTIDKILAATGLTYEEAFGTAEDAKGSVTDGRCEMDQNNHRHL